MSQASIIDLTKQENRVSVKIIDTGLYIHRHLGPGLLETAYEEALVYFLNKGGFKTERQKKYPIIIHNHKIANGFRADLVVEDCVICEIKSVEKLIPLYDAQLMTYLRLSNIKTGLLMNFGARLFKDGLKRIVV